MSPVDNYIFELDSNVTRTRVSYKNRYGITIAADLYLPKGFDTDQQHPAILVGSPPRPARASTVAGLRSSPSTCSTPCSGAARAVGRGVGKERPTRGKVKKARFVRSAERGEQQHLLVISQGD